MITVSRDAIQVTEKEIAEFFHFWKSLPAQCLEPAEYEVHNSGTRLIGPKLIELFAEQVRLEESAVDGFGIFLSDHLYNCISGLIVFDISIVIRCSVDRKILHLSQS